MFFDIEKSCGMMWKEGLLIKLHKMGAEGKAFNWIKDILFGRKIQVRIGSARSLFADDGALWKRGRNMEHAVRKVQRAIVEVVE